MLLCLTCDLWPGPLRTGCWCFWRDVMRQTLQAGKTANGHPLLLLQNTTMAEWRSPTGWSLRAQEAKAAVGIKEEALRKAVLLLWPPALHSHPVIHPSAEPTPEQLAKRKCVPPAPQHHKAEREKEAGTKWSGKSLMPGTEMLCIQRGTFEKRIIPKPKQRGEKWKVHHCFRKTCELSTASQTLVSRIYKLFSSMLLR